MEPRVVASPDGAHLVVLREQRLSLFSLESGRRVATAEVAGTEVAFAGHYVVVHHHDEHASVVTILTMPTLAVNSCHELNSPTRILATASGYVLLDRGDQALMIPCGRDAAVSSLRPPAAFTHAAGLGGPQFVTFGPRGAELWDAAARRPEARLRLELPPDTVEVGVTNRYASLWMATREPCLHLARISDGRISTVWLDATPRHLRSHPVAAWVVADVGPRALAINLAIGEVVPLATGGGSIVAVAPRRDRDAGAVVVILDGDALELRLLGGEARPLPRRDDDGGDPLTAAAPAVETGIALEPATTESASRSPSLRERLVPRTPERAVVSASTEPIVAHEVGRSSPALARLGRPMMRSLGAEWSAEPVAESSPAPVAGSSAESVAGSSAEPVAGSSAESVAGSSAEPGTAAPAQAPTPPRPPLATPRRAPASVRDPAVDDNWRGELLAWSRAGGPAPTSMGSPLQALHARLGLSTVAWPIMCALYGQWLGGAGARGLAIRQLLARVGDAPGAWPEALGVVGLGAYGLLEWHHGRARLPVALGDFLDGRPPALATLHGERARRAPAHGQVEVRGGAGAPAWRHALTEAEALGQVALWTGALVGPPLAQVRLEAWLRRLALVVAGDPGPLALLPEEAVIAVVSPPPS